jgi:endo-1,4-beta-xylanase
MGIAAVIAAGALVLAPLVPAAAATTVISSVDFDDGSTGAWTQSGGDASTLSVVDLDGDKVLQVANRSADYVGLQSPTGLFEPGKTYDFSMRVRLADGTPATQARFVMKPDYTWIGNGSVTAGAWTTLTGSFTADAAADPAALQAYIGTGDTGAPYTYFVDDILVTTEGATTPPGTTVVSSVDFQDSTTGTWTQSGGDASTLSIVDLDGGKVLLVANRSADYVGLQSPTGLFEPGKTYTLSMRVRLADGTPATQARFVMKPAYTWIGNGDVTAGAWTTLSGDITIDAAADPSTLQVYIGTGDTGAPYTYFVDDILITTESTTPPGPTPGTVVIDTDFEQGLDGWAPRDSGPGAPTVTLSPVAHGGAQAALISDRLNQGSGLGHDVLNLLEEGATYEVSAWVRFAEGAATDDVWLSLQRDSSFQTLGQFTGITDSGWTQVTATFTMGSAATTALLYFETRYDNGATGNTSDFLVDDIVVKVPEPAVIQDITPMKDTLPFPIGVAIDSRETAGSASQLLLRHSHQVTPENYIKPEAWSAADKTFSPSPEIDSLMSFAKAHDLRVYGHVLVWHSQTPAWFFQDDAGQPLTTNATDQQILKDRLKSHIDHVAQYLSSTYGAFGGGNPIVAFDVVNEVVSDSATDPGGLRQSEWYRILGEQFIDLAFQYADDAFNHQYAAAGADRPVTLFINDYNTEQSGKQQRYHDLVQRLIARGVTVDGVGHQFHVNLAMPVSALDGALTAFDDLPVKQAVTEFDVPTGTPVSRALLIDQGYYYRDAFRVFRAHADKMFSVTVWGLTDGRSWRSSSGAPLIFDDKYQAKPAYDGVVDGTLPAPMRTADVFAGDVAIDADAPTALEWRKLPLHDISGVGGFQLRWAPDHLTAYVTVKDATPAAGDSVALQIGTTTYTVARSGSGDATATAKEITGGYTVVARLPLDAATQGSTLSFDVRVTDGATTTGWNAPGVLGTLTLIEPLSYLEVAQVAAAPAIDGTVDAAWAASTPVTTAKQVSGTSGATASVRTLWKDDTLYVLAEVADPTIDVTGSDPWIQDSVEIYVDPGNAKNGGYRADDMQLRISATNVLSFGTGDEAAQRARVQTATKTVAGGYVVEAAIGLLGHGGSNTFLGLDFQVNDATGGARTSITNWADPTGTGYQTTAHWGVGQLIPAPAPTKPVNLTPPTITGRALVGETLTAKPGTWDTSGLTFAYQWKADGQNIPGATKARYKLAKKDVGAAVTVVVTATKKGLDAATATSAPVKVQAASTTSLQLSRHLATSKAATTATISVSSSVKVTGGTVQLTVNGTAVGTAVPVDSKGKAKITVPKFGGGLYVVRAVYSGAGDVAGSTSNAELLVILF